jgi:hypothetical protein
VIRAICAFFGQEAIPRSRGILLASETGIAAALAILLGIFAHHLAVATTATGDVVVAVLAYAAIGFGFSVAGLTIVLTAPDHEFAHELAWSDPSEGAGIAKEPPKRSSYANLLFIFAWTAMAHWAVIIAGFTLLLGLGKDTPLMGNGASTLHRVGVSLAAFITIYAVELFLITVISIAQAGGAYIDRLHRTRPAEP